MSSSDWLPEIRDEWAALWSHPIVRTYDRTVHEPALRRLFDLRDERERISRIVRATPMVEGSQGQDRPHPLYARLGVVESKIFQLEGDFGLTSKSLLDLGITFGQAKRSLDDLSRGDDRDDEATGEGGDEDDPRGAIEATSREAPRRPTA